MDPTNTYVVLDMRSGTFFGADDACLIDTAKLSPEELEDLNEGTDTDRLQIANKHGITWPCRDDGTISFDVISHVRDNWHEDIPESKAAQVAEAAINVFDCTLTWDEIDRCISSSLRQLAIGEVA